MPVDMGISQSEEREREVLIGRRGNGGVIKFEESKIDVLLFSNFSW